MLDEMQNQDIQHYCLHAPQSQHEVQIQQAHLS